VRIRGVNGVPPDETKTLDLLRLRRVNAAVFIRNNGPVRAMLQKVRNYIAWGTIDIHLLRRLIYERGMCKIGHSRYNISNEIVEEFFDGELKCIEDLVYHIYCGTPLFKKVNKFLWPFGLSCPVKGFRGRKARDYVQGGACGNHFGTLGNLVSRMI
jgi:large subunit ribosomal protein L7e